jgi:BolA protein
MTDVERTIEAKIRAALQPVAFELRNDSEQHRGHPGHTSAHSHLFVRVVSDKFVGLSAVKRHKLVYAVLAEELKHEVHALQIDALAPDEAR